MCLIFFAFCSIYYAPVPVIFPNPFDVSQSRLIRGFKHIPLTQVYPWQHSDGPLILRAENSTLRENFVFEKHLPPGWMQAGFGGEGGFVSWILGGGGVSSRTCWSSTSTKRYLPWMRLNKHNPNKKLKFIL